MRGNPVSNGAGEAPVTARWLAGAAGALLALGVVSAGMVNGGDDGGGRVVAAAGRAGSTVAVATSTSSSTTVVPPRTSTPPSTVARPTTVPKAASALLAAIGSTTTTAPPPPPSTTTTRPAVTTTAPTVPSSTSTTSTSTSTSTTSTTVAPRATVTIVNEHPNAFVVTVNGRPFEPPLASGERIGPVEITLPGGADDTVSLEAVSDPSCRVVVTRDLFQPGGTHRYRIVAGSGSSCTSIPTPTLEPLT